MNRSKIITIMSVLGIQAILLLTISMIDISPKISIEENVPTARALKCSFPIDVLTIGELEAARSISIASTIRHDQLKLINLIADGTHVNTGDLLIKLDPTPFEKKIEELEISIKEAESQIKGMENSLAWEIDQAELEAKTAAYDIESAELEINKVMLGDGPMEITRLKGIMQKAEVKFQELSSYADDLIALEKEGFLDSIEVKQTQKKLQEEQEIFENAKSQYESFIIHAHPMQIKKAESMLKRLINKREEIIRSGKFKIAKAAALLEQAQQQLLDIKYQLKDAYVQLALTEIRAPSPGMVVYKEDYRNGQRRRPRIGDSLVRNQTILDLPDMSNMIVKTKVREIDLYKVEVGNKAVIEVDAYPNLIFEGKVTFIGILALSDMVRPGDDKYFEVKIALDHSDERLRPGMTSRVVIKAGQIEDTLSVPIQSVFEFEKKHFCYVVKGRAYLMKPVKIGMNNDQWVTILSGLDENDQICLAMPPESLIGDLIQEESL